MVLRGLLQGYLYFLTFLLHWLWYFNVNNFLRQAILTPKIGSHYCSCELSEDNVVIFCRWKVEALGGWPETSQICNLRQMWLQYWEEWENRQIYTHFFFGKCEKGDGFGDLSIDKKSKRRWEDNIKIYLKIAVSVLHINTGKVLGSCEHCNEKPGSMDWLGLH
jgi:hypothetical protein